MVPRAASLALVLLVSVSAAHATPTDAGAAPTVVVIARLERIVQGGAPCGQFFFIGESEYRVVHVERGEPMAEHIAVEVPCPADFWTLPAGPLVRLELTSVRPQGWPAIPHQTERLPRLFQVHESSLIPELLDMPAVRFNQLFTPTGTDGQWTLVGDDLAVVLEGAATTQRVVRVRIRLPPHWPTGEFHDLTRMGFSQYTAPDTQTRDGAQWSGSAKHHVAPGVAGRRAGRWLELWKTP